MEWRTSSVCSVGGCVELAPLKGGGAALRDSKSPDKGHYRFNEQEWRDFIVGAKAGEFDFFAE